MKPLIDYSDVFKVYNSQWIFNSLRQRFPILLVCLCSFGLLDAQAALNNPFQNQESSPRRIKNNVDLQDDEKIVVDTDLATILMTATDKKGRFITTLTSGDVAVFEDGVRQQITIFERETDRPILLALAFDTSGSQAETLPEQKKVARAFLNTIFRPGKDKIAIISFAGETILQQGFTDDVTKVEAAINRVEIVGGFGPQQGNPSQQKASPPQTSIPIVRGGTSMFDSIFLMCLRVFSKTPTGARRALILLTDGMDTTSRLTAQDAVNGAVYTNTIIYGVGIGERFRVNESAISFLAEETGGRAFFPQSREDLTSSFDAIEQELRSQYLIAYQPVNKVRDGKRRNIQIDLSANTANKDKLRLAYRDHYYVRKAVPAK